MIKTLKAHFDGKVIVLDEAVDLPVGQPVLVRVESEDSAPSSDAGTVQPEHGEPRPLMRLIEALEGLPCDVNGPTDRAAQVDHYLYGHPKRP